MKDNRPFDGAEHITLDSDICLADRHCPSIMKNIFIIVLLLSTFVVFPITAAETGSGIVLRPHDETVRKELLRGHTYTSEDCSDIKSGTMTVSEDGYTLTLDNLVLECSKDGDEGSLLRFDPNELYTLSLTGENVVSTNGYAAIVAGDLIITGEGSLTTKSRYFDIHSYFGRTVWIDNTTLICQGQRAILSEGGKVSVFNSRFEGNELRGVSQLSMIDCSIKVPYHGWFDAEEKDKCLTSSKKRPYELAKQYNVKIIFLPPYSPELNPIDHFWHWLNKTTADMLKKFLDLKTAIFTDFQMW